VSRAATTARLPSSWLDLGAAHRARHRVRSRPSAVADMEAMSAVCPSAVKDMGSMSAASVDRRHRHGIHVRGLGRPTSRTWEPCPWPLSTDVADMGAMSVASVDRRRGHGSMSVASVDSRRRHGSHVQRPGRSRRGLAGHALAGIDRRPGHGLHVPGPPPCSGPQRRTCAVRARHAARPQCRSGRSDGQR
jgi:hypothetical protein